MKIKIIDKQYLDNWFRRSVLPYGLRLQPRGFLLGDDVQKLVPPITDFREIDVSPYCTVESLIHQLLGDDTNTFEKAHTDYEAAILEWRSLKDKTSENHRLRFHETLDSIFYSERGLYFLFASSEELTLSKRLCDYGIQGDDLLLLKENKIYLNDSPPLYSLRARRDADDFPKRLKKRIYDFREIVGSKEEVKHLSQKSIETINGVLLYTEEDAELAQYVRYNFSALHEMTGFYLNIFTIEQESQFKGISTRNYWKAKLEENAYSFLHLLGWTRYKPYDKANAYKIAQLFGVYPDALPCLILFDNIESGNKIVITIEGKLPNFFRTVSANVLRTIEEIQSNSCKDFEDFRLSFLQRLQPSNDKLSDLTPRFIYNIFNDKTVYINKPCGKIELKNFQQE